MPRQKRLCGSVTTYSPWESAAEAERELYLVEEKLEIAHVDRVDLKLNCTLVMLPSKHPYMILMQREGIIIG